MMPENRRYRLVEGNGRILTTWASTFAYRTSAIIRAEALGYGVYDTQERVHVRLPNRKRRLEHIRQMKAVHQRRVDELSKLETQILFADKQMLGKGVSS